MERPQHLLLVAIWQIFCAVTAFLGILTMLLVILPAFIGMVGYGFGVFPNVIVLFAGTGAIFLLGFFIISLVAAIGTVKGASWARNLGIVQAGISILNVPVGTIAGILIIMYLVRPEVTGYFYTGNGNGQPALNPAAAA